MAHIIDEEMLVFENQINQVADVRPGHTRQFLNSTLRFFERPASNQLEKVTHIQRVGAEAVAAFITVTVSCFLASAIIRFDILSWPFTWLVNPICTALSILLQYVVVGRYVPETHGNLMMSMSTLVSHPPQFHRRQVFSYWMGHILGTLGAVVLLRFIFPSIPICPIECHTKIYICGAIEYIFTFGLTYSRTRILSHPRLFPHRVLLMSGVNGIIAFGGGHISGPALGPLRYFAPALVDHISHHVMDDLSHHILGHLIVYFICPVLGSLSGGALSRFYHGEIPDLSGLIYEQPSPHYMIVSPLTASSTSTSSNTPPTSPILPSRSPSSSPDVSSRSGASLTPGSSGSAIATPGVAPTSTFSTSRASIASPSTPCTSGGAATSPSCTLRVASPSTPSRSGRAAITRTPSPSTPRSGAAIAPSPTHIHDSDGEESTASSLV